MVAKWVEVARGKTELCRSQTLQGGTGTHVSDYSIGRETVKEVPFPYWELTSMTPPWD